MAEEKPKNLWWQEDGESILFSANSDGESAHPDANAIESLLLEGTPEENAENFKEQGNKCLKQGPKYYRDAIQFYTDALNQKVASPQKNSVYLANRAHVNLLLGMEGQ